MPQNQGGGVARSQGATDNQERIMVLNCLTPGAQALAKTATDALTAANVCEAEALAAEKMTKLTRAVAFNAAHACQQLDVAAKSTAALDAENGQGGVRAELPPGIIWKAPPPQPPGILSKATSAAQGGGRSGIPAKAPAPPLPSP